MDPNSNIGSIGVVALLKYYFGIGGVLLLRDEVVCLPDGSLLQQTVCCQSEWAQQLANKKRYLSFLLVSIQGEGFGPTFFNVYKDFLLVFEWGFDFELLSYTEDVLIWFLHTI